MSSQVKKNNVFQKMSNKYETVKGNVKKIVNREKAAYNLGYQSGLRDYPKLPQVSGARIFAVSGYRRSLTDSHKSQKLSKKLTK